MPTTVDPIRLACRCTATSLPNSGRIFEGLRSRSRAVYKMTSRRFQRALTWRCLSRTCHTPRCSAQTLRLEPLLGPSKGDLVVTTRPPATKAPCHHRESDVLLDKFLRCPGVHPDTKIILLLRTLKHEYKICEVSQSICPGKIASAK
jgi:hypothetical protein